MSAIGSTHADPSASGTTRNPGLSWWQASLLGAVTATAVNLAIWGVSALAGASLALLDNGEDYLIDAGSVIFSSAVPIVVGIALAALIARWWTGVIRVAQAVGALLAVGTLWSVFAYGIGAGTITALTLMHLVSGAVVVLALEGLRRRVLDRSRAQ